MFFVIKRLTCQRSFSYVDLSSRFDYIKRQSAKCSKLLCTGKNTVNKQVEVEIKADNIQQIFYIHLLII